MLCKPKGKTASVGVSNLNTKTTWHIIGMKDGRINKISGFTFPLYCGFSDELRRKAEGQIQGHNLSGGNVSFCSIIT